VNKRALLVGVDQYSPSLGHDSELRGCVNDVEDLANVLVMSGYRYDMIKIITNERANKQNILGSLNWLYNSSAPGDYIIFYFAGHGSRIIERYDSTQGGYFSFQSKEVICPYDTNFELQNYITDSELRNVFSSPMFPPGKVEIILDCGLSDFTSMKSKPQDEDSTRGMYVKTRSLAPPLDFNFYEKYNFFLPTERLLKAQEQHKISLPNGWPFALWIGSKDNQSCYETKINGQIRGVFTYNFCKAIRDSNMRLSRGILCGVINTYIKQAELRQSALLQTSSESEVTSTFDFPPDPYTQRF
jgi:hypothetical protein